MKTCFSTLGCPEWSFSDIISVASDLQYDGIEIRGILGELYAPPRSVCFCLRSATKQWKN